MATPRVIKRTRLSHAQAPLGDELPPVEVVGFLNTWSLKVPPKMGKYLFLWGHVPFSKLFWRVQVYFLGMLKRLVGRHSQVELVR